MKKARGKHFVVFHKLNHGNALLSDIKIMKLWRAIITPILNEDSTLKKKKDLTIIINMFVLFPFLLFCLDYRL